MNSKNSLSRRALSVSAEPLAASLMAKAIAHPNLISLAAGFVDRATLPIEPTQSALAAIFADDNNTRAALQYGNTNGYLPLRDAVFERLRESDGRAAELNLAPEQIVLTAGSNQLLFLVSDAICNPGDIILCASPTYYVYLDSLRNLGVRAIGASSDELGLIPEALEAEIDRLEKIGELDRVKAIYLTSYFDNPCGATTPGDRRRKIVELAKRHSKNHSIYVIEDAAYRELRYSGIDEPSMRSFDEDGSTVIYAGTFSKSFSPGIRVGWGLLPPSLTPAVLAMKGNIDFGSPHFNQVLMATVLERNLFDPHLERLRTNYRKKLQATLSAAEELLRPLGAHWAVPTGGLYLWLEMPEEIDASLGGRLFDLAVEEGVLYIPGDRCFPEWGEPAKKNSLRLSFGVPDCDTIRCGVEALARAIGRLPRE